MTFRIDANGLLNVFAKDVSTGNSEGLTITNEELNLPRAEIGRLVEQGEFERERARLLRNYQDAEMQDSAVNGNLN